jgi:hypothetical protein
MPTVVTLDYACNPTRTLAVTVDEGDGSKQPIYGRDLRNNPSVVLTSQTPAAQAGGADLAYAAILVVPAGTNVDIDLQDFTDVAKRANQSFVRIKSVEFWLLGSGDTSPAGNACEGVTIKPGTTNGNTLFLAGTAPQISLGNGERVEWSTRKAAGKTVDATHKVVNVACTDVSVDARLLVQIVGGSV